MNRRSVLKFLGLGSLFGLGSEAMAKPVPDTGDKLNRVFDAVKRTEAPEVESWQERQYQEMLRYKEVLRERDPAWFAGLKATELHEDQRVETRTVFSGLAHDIVEAMGVPEELHYGPKDSDVAHLFLGVPRLCDYVLKKSLSRSLPVYEAGPTLAVLRKEYRRVAKEGGLPLSPFRLSTKQFVLDSEDIDETVLAQVLISVSTIGDLLRENASKVIERQKAVWGDAGRIEAYSWASPKVRASYLSGEVILQAFVTGVGVIFNEQFVSRKDEVAWIRKHPWHIPDANALTI